MQKTVSFKIKPELFDKLTRISKVRGVTFSKLIIESLESNLNTQTSKSKKDFSQYGGLLSESQAEFLESSIKTSREISKDREVFTI
jgi:hypothetical protein